MLLTNPSILISLCLLVKLASSATLAPYFKPKVLDSTVADGILKRYQGYWSGILNTKVLREHLQAGKNNQIHFILEELNGRELDLVLDAVLYPSCTTGMLETLEASGHRLCNGASGHGLHARLHPSTLDGYEKYAGCS